MDNGTVRMYGMVHSNMTLREYLRITFSWQNLKCPQFKLLKYFGV